MNSCKVFQTSKLIAFLIFLLIFEKIFFGKVFEQGFDKYKIIQKSGFYNLKHNFFDFFGNLNQLNISFFSKYFFFPNIFVYFAQVLSVTVFSNSLKNSFE